MAEPENIVAFLQNHLLKGLPLQGKKVMITAGPTHEALDPVRFLGNRSTGTMGFALANTAASLGAEVMLITGPTHLTTNHSRIKTIPIVTAEEMYAAAKTYFAEVAIFISAAAVADYRPKTVATQKLKKVGNEEGMFLELERTTDILAALGAQKTNQYVVGFALESQNGLENAKAKLTKKNLDAIVLNSLEDDGAGFGAGTNKITLIHKNSEIKTFGTKPKDAVAADIWSEIIAKIDA